MFYGVEEIKAILGVHRTKAYDIIKKLRADLKSEGYIEPPAGKIQKKYFCDRFNLNYKDCERFLSEVA